MSDDSDSLAIMALMAGAVVIVFGLAVAWKTNKTRKESIAPKVNTVQTAWYLDEAMIPLNRFLKSGTTPKGKKATTPAKGFLSVAEAVIDIMAREDDAPDWETISKPKQGKLGIDLLGIQQVSAGLAQRNFFNVYVNNVREAYFKGFYSQTAASKLSSPNTGTGF